MTKLHRFYANIQLRSNPYEHDYSLSKYPCTRCFFIAGSFSTSTLSLNNPTMTSITRFTFLRNSFSSSEPSFKADSLSLILRGSLLVHDIPSDIYRMKYQSVADDCEIRLEQFLLT